ncbi:MAG: MogA/MoaB family molybdenum cofactor biosynthesis protein [Dehalococcoidales bacterium]|nr:MAG: MogA/MoaB family molybdenum cofactor biosynthesis protein [Dehalococcoidales bacterium]
MSYHKHKEASPVSVSCAVLTVSDSRTEKDDESGRILRQKLEQNGHRVISHAILKNDANTLENRLEELLAMKELQVIITSGGTGTGSRDITVETVSPMLEKRLDGFGELFRFLTYQELGTASIMSRAVGGISRGKVILCLPGSPGAANLAMDRVILPEISHLVREATR